MSRQPKSKPNGRGLLPQGTPPTEQPGFGADRHVVPDQFGLPVHDAEPKSDPASFPWSGAPVPPQDPALLTVVAGYLAERVQERVTRANCPTYSTSFVKSIEDTAESEVRVGNPSPLDPGRISHRERITEVGRAGERLAVAHAECRQARDVREAAERARAEVLPRPSVLKRSLPYLGAALLTVFVIIGTAGLLRAPLDAFVLRAYFIDLLGAVAGKRAAFGQAWWLGLGIATAVFSPLTVATLVARGRTGSVTKIVGGIGEILFAAGFTALRVTTTGLSASSIAWGLMEGALALLHIVAVVIIGADLKRQAEEDERQILAEQREATAATVLARREEAVAHATAEHRQALQFVEVHEEAAIRVEDQVTLARRTARLEYLVETLRLIGGHVSTPFVQTGDVRGDEAAESIHDGPYGR